VVPQRALILSSAEYNGSNICWVDPGYISIYRVLANSVYAGAYAYGKSRHEVTLDASGARKKRVPVDCRRA
jgi:hypothetical protein